MMFLLVLFVSTEAMSQRRTDDLDRGLIAISQGSGVFCSWRILADEYYGVKYNLYRNGQKVNNTPLNVSNYQDNSGNTQSTYTVRAVVGGVEQQESKVAYVLTTKDGSNNPYINIPMKNVVDRNGNVVYATDGSVKTWDYWLNDCSVADLDGDGEMEVIVKRINQTDASTAYPDGTAKLLYEEGNTTAYTLIEAYKLNGTRLWWIDCGPNMVSLNSTEINAVAYDWDEDGKAEVIMRGADNMIIHMADGTAYNVGDMAVNTRYDMNHENAQYAWTKIGNEYLLYLNGATAKPYSITEFPLKRVETGETLASAWAEGIEKQAYGHRSSKYFFGAPVLDGRKASIFLGRGIYTQTKMCALDVNPQTHQLTTRWTWKCNTKGSPWYGQGNHNMNIADVDGDGCDEIIYGSMVIDNNGKGLSTTGLGHGDALHTGDLDPFRKGMETFACNEDNPGSNYRNATTSEIYYRMNASSDDGRCMAGNFSNDYPGSIGASTSTGVLALSAEEVKDIDGWTNNWLTNTPNPMALNFRIYWDGDLLEESINGPGSKEGELFVGKNGARIFMSNGAQCNNDTKKNPCFSGDIIGDWREELIMRSNDNNSLRIYTTTYPTEHRVPCLWFDHEYRQAMVWQMCAYNQPPHVSFFMGEMEGLTKVPVPNTMKNRMEVSNNGNVTSEHNGKDVILYGAGKYGIDGDNSPKTVIVDVPSTVSGNDDNNNITYSYGQTQLGTGSYKGNMTGDMTLVKQGDGLLKLTARTFDYAGPTDVYAGSLYFRGTLANSPVWMNRHTTLYTAGTYKRKVTMEYGATMHLSYNNANNDGSMPATEYTTATIDSLELHEGARVVIDIDGSQTDLLQMKELTIRTRDWQYGPKYLAPVLQINSTSTLSAGKYKIGTVTRVNGALNDVVIEGDFAQNTTQRLSAENGTFYLNVETGYIEEEKPTNVIGATTTTWDFKELYNTNGFTTATFLTMGSDITTISKTQCANTTATGMEGLVFQNGNNIWRLTNAGLRDQATGARTMGVLNLKKGDIVTVVGAVSGNEAAVVSLTTGNANVSVDNHVYTFTMTEDGNLGLSVARTASSNYYTIEKITLVSPSCLTLDALNETAYESGIYDVVRVNRAFNAGYSTICLPFDATVSELTGGDNGAFATYLADVNMKDGGYNLIFNNTQEIKANKPYIIYLTAPLSQMEVKDKAVYQRNPQTIYVDVWSMSGNYTPNKSMAGLYGIANNLKIMKGGQSSYLNGLTAYLTGPQNMVNAAKIVFANDWNDATDITTTESDTNADSIDAIYSANGVRMAAPLPGMNIVRMSNGRVIRIFVK